ncbi:coagulation factor III, tissue factor a isoform X2 [Salarias fasciatus]|uniref:Tissue factor n=1 Tax=Salarias fasciatus TaxID=181472 RepID=A0A672JHT2_SALFA|nr:tissue factor isoform X2 [Salarias fasciatus]XP_029955577.1 tissue factor isoform X2 [Salarias fasciatus]XP_029955578.1 tissue factor isoform X2 [Salarias fasciatus]
MAHSPAALLSLILSVWLHTASGSVPRAQNITWRSTNFKTVLMWEPEPSEEFSYTVELAAVGEDKRRIAHCVRSSLATCDVSMSLTKLDACYTADVLTEPPRGTPSDLPEPPHSSSPRFCPHSDTVIGRPDFKLRVSEDQQKTTLFVSDPLTAVFSDGRQLSVRDIFSEQLQYRVTYRRNKSTGQKVHTSKSNEIELSGLDPGESYCFNVQAFIPSRTAGKQLGDMSETQCSQEDNPSIFKVYSVGVIACAIFLILLLIGIVIAVAVVCCKRRKSSLKSGKEGVPLQNV